MEIFIGYLISTGEIKMSGRVDRSEEPDGSTVWEKIQAELISHPNIGIIYLPNQPLPDKYTKQIVNGELVDRLPGFKLEEEIRQEEVGSETASNPLANMTFAPAVDWINENVTDLASAKAAMKKIVKLILLRT